MAFTVTATVEVSLDTVANILCSALEGGSNYWYEIDSFVEPKQIAPEIAAEWGGFRHISYPLSEGGGLKIRDIEGSEDATKLQLLDLKAVAFGVQTMATKYPKHFADMVQENDDAITGDVLLQCCLFGELVYG